MEIDILKDGYVVGIGADKVMYSFLNDYSEGAHPKVLEALVQTNLEQTSGYGKDHYTTLARHRIKDALGVTYEADVHIAVGGTQANALVISAALRPYEAVIAADTYHINVHETGAIEATGHKIIAMPGENGKLTPALVRQAVANHPDEHTVKPKMVYISQTTEIGTLYSKAELSALSKTCRELGLFLYVDGARLASALTAPGADVTLPDLVKLADAFTIGGTKCGAMMGEAIVLVNDAVKPDFRYMIKRQGAMFAKGRLLGIQFAALFENDLYWEIYRHENACALLLKQAFEKQHVPMYSDSVTNQQFAVVSPALKSELSKHYRFEQTLALDETHLVVRFVTSFATDMQEAENFEKTLAACLASAAV